MAGEFQHILYRQSENEPGTFYFIPGDPGPELTPSGAPAASMILSDSAGILQLGVHWDVTPDQMKALQEHLRRQFPELSSSPQLRMEALSVEAVKLALTMPDGTSTELATTSSSGYLPFTALFNLTLDGARYTQTRLAITGQPKVLKVSYEVSGQSHLVCTAAVSGDVRQDLEQLDVGADIDACRARIESALSDGRIQLATSGDDVSETLRARTINAAKDQAANVLQRMLSGTDATLDAAHLYAAATLSEEHPVKLVREADVGGWFAGSKAASLLVSPSAKALSPGGRVPRAFQIGFDAKDLPIAFVQVSCAGSQAVLQPPAFKPVTLTVEAGKPVDIKTSYTDGGPTYQVQIDAKTEVVALTPQQLGLCLVNFDGAARKQAGAKRIRIQAKYHPQGNGSEDDRTITWGYGDWTDSWHVVSRDSDLAGVIEYSWEETASDGTETSHPAVKTGTPEVKL